jgi:phospholipid/cholesterol/gamma-HCH transport system substrate-binding protein
MNTRSSTHIKLGIFVTIGFILLAVAVYFISAKQQFFSKTFRISAIFGDVSGLQAGNNVRFAGVTVGLIASINIESDTTVRVDMLINEDASRFIKKDAVASIGSEGLMGNKIVIVTPGTANQPEIEEHDFVTTIPPLNFDRVLNKFKTTSDNVEHITADLADIVHSIRRGKGTIGQLLMDSTYLKQTRDNLTQITSDVVAISGSLRSGRTVMGKLLMDSTYLTIPINNAIRITSDLSDITASVRSGKGAAGRLLMDSATAFTLDTTLINVKKGTYQMEHRLEEARKSFLLWGF